MKQRIYMDVFVNSVIETLRWVWASVRFDLPWYTNYFWGLIAISLLVWVLEICFPWRKNQSVIRKDFWLDAFYMFFNFFVFAILISGFYALLESGFGALGISVQSLALINLSGWPVWVQLIVFFIVLDFVQWITHRALHRFEVLWRFHKVHHSVKEMGFAAHLRYHWMENVLYKPLKTLAVMVLGGFEPEYAYVVHFLAITIGHFNHANIKITWGPLKYVFNNPVMHLYHHAYHLPKEHPYGMNFGISLSLWDYLFGTHYVPEDSGTIPLGFEGDATFPKDFVGQNIQGFWTKSEESSH